MDAYTRRTREWLDAIYEGPAGAPYVPHGPVHGFEPTSRYLGTYSHLYAILSELAALDFESCLEVGSGEGLLADLIRRVFGARVAGVDLSHRVCRRAAEVFDLRCAVGEARELPFASQSVDVVVSINTLEHIADIATAWAELRRVARRAIVIGLPHARRPGEAEAPDEPHAHVSLLTRAEMRGIFGREARIRGSVSRLARPLYALAARDDVSQRQGYEFLRRPWLRPFYALAHGLARRADARRTVAWLCRLEDRWSRRWPGQTYESIVVAKLPGASPARRPVTGERILEELLR